MRTITYKCSQHCGFSIIVQSYKGKVSLDVTITASITSQFWLPETFLLTSIFSIGNPFWVKKTSFQVWCLPIRQRYRPVLSRDHLNIANDPCWFTSLLPPQIMDRAVLHVENSYKIPNVTVRGHLCKTNLPSNTAFRGFGAPQSFLICENWMEQAAQKLNISCDKVKSSLLI